MFDELWGDVAEVIDGDTFDVTVTHYKRSNRYPYNTRERIRFASLNAPELPTRLGETAKDRLDRHIGRRHVHLIVHARDTFSRLVCDVTLTVRT